MSKGCYAAVLLWAFLCCPAPARAGTTGKIAGIVTEAGTNGPLPGVQIVIEETGQGTTTNADGYYALLNVKPGTYTVVFKFIGFADVRVNNVQVEVDKTTPLDMQMSETVIEGQEVVITAERPIVQMDRTTTTSFVDEKQIQALPVTGINEVIDLQAGVVDGHFRGGRSGEVAYLVNGVPINNAYNNTAAFEVEQNMISSLEVISGVFNAEYGQAMSGVVNIVTKDVPRAWEGSFLGYVGSIASGRALEFVERTAPAGTDLSADDFQSVQVPYSRAAGFPNRQDLQLELGGPLLKERLGLRLTGRYYFDEGHTIGRRLFAPSDSSRNLNSGGRDVWSIASSGDQAFVPSEARRYSLNASTVFNLSPRVKADYNLFLQRARNRTYVHDRKYVPDGNNWDYGFSATHILGLRFTLGNTSFANVSYSLLRDHSWSRLYDIPGDFDQTGLLDARYVSPQLGGLSGTNAFSVGGNDLFNWDRLTQTHTLVADYTNQVNPVHQVKAGGLARFHRLDNQSYGIEVSPRTGYRARPSLDRFEGDTLNARPLEFSAYVQDKMEFKNLIVNLGLRYDYFNADFLVPNGIAGWEQPGRRYILDLSTPEPADSISNRITAPVRQQLSPRIGIAFPISSQGVLRFSAGLFFQIPAFNLLYTNPEYEVNPVTGVSQFGNAGIDPERTLMFEMGLQQGLSESMGIELTIFSKDIRNLTGQEVRRDVRSTNYLIRYINRDYGTIRGLTLSLYQRPVGPLSWTLDYTLQFAEGSASNPNEAFLRELAGLETDLHLVRLEWDRRHSLNNSITFTPGRALSISMVNRLLSGTPYTTVREFIRSLRDNNQDKPFFFLSDLRVYYTLPLLPGDVQLFLQADNLFDAAPHYTVYNDTGLADESVEKELFRRSGTPVGGVNSLDEYYARPWYFGSPRRVSAGLRYQF